MRHRHWGGVWLAGLLVVLAGARGVASVESFGGSCSSELGGAATIVTGTTTCGASVSFTGNGSAQVVTMRLGFSVNDLVPNDATFSVTLPTDRNGFVFNSGATTDAIGVVTPLGSERFEPLHGTGTPLLSITDSVATIQLAGLRQTSLADAQAGYQVDLTNIRNPYANEGLARTSATFTLFYNNGSIWHETQVLLPEFVYNPMLPSAALFELLNPSAGIVGNMRVTFSTSGEIPALGRIEVTLPAGFVLLEGSVVALEQRNLGSDRAVYVSAISTTLRRVTLLVTGRLGTPPGAIPALDRASLVLTAIRTPAAGLTGTFQIKTLSTGGDVVDFGDAIPGTIVVPGTLTDMTVGASDSGARLAADYSFSFRTTGVLPGDGKVILELPFGYFLQTISLLSYNGLGSGSAPSITGADRTIVVHLNGTNSSSDAIAQTTVTLSLRGIVNPGTGSASAAYLIKTAHSNGASIVDQGYLDAISITTALFPLRAVAISEARAGQPNTITVTFETAGFIPDDMRMVVAVPDGLGLSLPYTSAVNSSTCCELGICSACGITLVRITAQEVMVKLPGAGARNLEPGTNITFTIDNIRNLFAGAKNGFDLTLLLSDEISAAMQAKDVDGPVIIPGTCLSASADFAEYPNLEGSYNDPIAGHCGSYRFQVQLHGVLPAGAVFRVTFPSNVLLNDAWCDSIDNVRQQPVTRLTFTREPITLEDFVSEATGNTVEIMATGPIASPNYDKPQTIKFYLTNLRHLYAGSVPPLKFEALNPDLTLVEHFTSIPVTAVREGPFKAASALPASVAAGVRTTIDLSITLGGRLPITGIVRAVLPPSYRVSDGEQTAVLVSSIGGVAADMSVISADGATGVVKVRIDSDFTAVDGFAGSIYTCPDPETMTCPGTGDNADGIRVPTTYVAARLLAKNTVLLMTLSQIRNLAGGPSGVLQMQTRTPDDVGVVEENLAVPGTNLTIGLLADATVVPGALLSAIRTTVAVSISISNTLQLDGNIVLVFPLGFQINDGAPSAVTGATLVLFTQERSTPASVTSFDEARRSITIAVGGSPDEFLEAFNKVKLSVTNIRNMVARPVGTATAQVSGTFLVSTQLRSGAFVETYDAPGVSISTNVIAPFPVGDADAFPESSTPGAVGYVSIRYSTDSVLPSDAVIQIGFPNAYTFNVGGTTALSVSYDGVPDARYNLTLTPGFSSTAVRAVRWNGTSDVPPGVIVELHLTNTSLRDAVADTGVYNISTLTPDGATIARGFIPSTAIGRPSEPLSISVVNCKANYPEHDPVALCLSWAAPRVDGGSVVTGYSVTVDKSSNLFNDIVDTISLPPTNFSTKTIALTEGVYYYIRIRASNNNRGTPGFGRPGYAAVTRAVSLPSAPRAATLRSDTTNRLYASWLSPQFTGALNPAAEIINYKVEFGREDANFTTIGQTPNDSALAPSNVRFVVSQLLTPGLYYARVFAGNAVGFGPPAVFALPALATPIVPVAWDAAMPSEGQTLYIQVGYLLEVEVRAVDGDISDQVEVDVDGSRGLPVSAAVSATVVSGQNGGAANVATRIFTMVPQLTQVGLTLEVCFAGRNSNENPLGSFVDILRCILIQVVEPELSWTSSSTEALTPLADETFTTFPGCFVEIPVYATAVWYKVKFSYQASLIDFDGAEVPSGVVEGAEIVAPHPNALVDGSSAINIANNYSFSGLFRYRPSPSLSGRNQKVCFSASDEWGLRSIRRCVWVMTGSCRACLRDGQTLASLAAEYGTDWLQIWATNPRMGNPSRILSPGDVINLGVKYLAIGGETVEEIAPQLFSSIARVLETNPDFVQRSGGAQIAAKRALVPEQALCIIPPLCRLDCPGGEPCILREPSANKGFVA